VPHTLTFDTLHNYDAGEDGISLTVELQSGTARARVLAKLDTGASFCIFQREHGEALGLDIESGTPQRVGAATGSFLTFGHEITLTSLGISFTVTVYFAALYGFSRNVMGRRGWLDRLQAGIVDYEGKLFVSRYDAA
jgi:hypothetical protein